MVEELTQTMPEDLRQAFANAVRLYHQWRFKPDYVPAPTIDFRTLTVSLSGICDLIAAYKNEPLRFYLTMILRRFAGQQMSRFNRECRACRMGS